MKGAIANAVATFAQAAGSWSDLDTATIAGLRRELHEARNDLQVARGAWEVLAVRLGLAAETEPPEVLAAALRRIG